MDLQWITALIIIGCGVFILVYGSMLFRYVLAAGAFYIGFVLAGMLPFLANSPYALLFQVVIGGILAGIAFSLVKFALNIAGALLGFVLGLLVLSLLGWSDGWVASGIAIAAAAVGGIFGNRLGDWITILACAIAGSYAIIGGMNMLFNDGASASTLPRSPEVLIVFVVFAVIGTLAQKQIVDLRTRLLRR